MSGLDNALNEWEDVESVGSVVSIGSEGIDSLGTSTLGAGTASSLASTASIDEAGGARAVAQPDSALGTGSDNEDISDLDSLGDELDSLSLGSNTDESSGIENGNSAPPSRAPPGSAARGGASPLQAGARGGSNVGTYAAFDAYARQHQVLQNEQQPQRQLNGAAAGVVARALGRRKQRRKENDARLLSSLETLRARSALNGGGEEGLVGAEGNLRRRQALSLSVFPIPEFKSNFEDLFEDKDLCKRFAAGYNTVAKRSGKPRRARRGSKDSSTCGSASSDTDDTESDIDAAFF